jgi:microcystin-dependent protein
MAPEGWLLCDGSRIPDGERFDALRIVLQSDHTPDLRGRMILMADPTATVLAHSDAVLGATDGEERHTLTNAEMPAHNHNFPVNKEGCPDGGMDKCGYQYWSNNWPANVNQSTNYQGSSQPHNNMPPYVALNWIVKY